MLAETYCNRKICVRIESITYVMNHIIILKTYLVCK
jgi:hypothetical protein